MFSGISVIALVVSVSQFTGVGAQAKLVQNIEEVFRILPVLYEDWPGGDSYTCQFGESLDGVEIFGVSTALSLRASPMCSEVNEVHYCRADLILQWIRALIRFRKGKILLGTDELYISWRHDVVNRDFTFQGRCSFRRFYSHWSGNIRKLHPVYS